MENWVENKLLKPITMNIKSKDFSSDYEMPTLLKYSCWIFFQFLS